MSPWLLSLTHAEMPIAECHRVSEWVSSAAIGRKFGAWVTDCCAKKGVAKEFVQGPDWSLIYPLCCSVSLRIVGLSLRGETKDMGETRPPNFNAEETLQVSPKRSASSPQIADKNTARSRGAQATRYSHNLVIDHRTWSMLNLTWTNEFSMDNSVNGYPVNAQLDLTHHHHAAQLLAPSSSELNI